MKKLVKSQLKFFIKEYLLEQKFFKKSDRIYVTSIVRKSATSEYFMINIRKAFHKGNSIDHTYINGSKFQDWVILKKRTEKIKKLKNKIDGIQHDKRIKTSM